MTKITRIDNILEGTGVEREGAALQWMHDIWRAASAIPSPDYIPVAQWVIDAFDDALREAGQPADEPMDPMTAGDYPVISGLQPLCTLPSEVLGLTEFAGVLIAACEGGVYGVNPDGTYCSLTGELAERHGV